MLGLTACSGGAIPRCVHGTTRTLFLTVSVDPDPNLSGKYTPATVSVKILDSMTWQFTDSSRQHSVTADNRSFDSCPLDAGAFFTVKFSQAGTYKYHCRIHPTMLGEVNVG